MDKRWTFFSADFELSAHCATACRICPRERLTRKKGEMDLGQFQRLAPILANIQVRVTFCGMGNPVLNPDWPGFIKAYRELNGFCGIVLHATELTDDVLNGLNEAGPNVVEMSFPSVDPTLFNALCPKVSYDLALTRAEQLINYPNRCFAVVPVGVRTALNPKEPEKSATFWLARGANARVTTLHSRGGHLSDARLGDFPDPGLRQPCGLLAMHAFVAWNGDLLGCCHDLEGKTKLGNVFDDDMETLMDRKVAALASVPHFDICRNCADDYRLKPVPAGAFPETKSARKKALRRLAADNETK